jgi:hypothetical protein
MIDRVALILLVLFHLIPSPSKIQETILKLLGCISLNKEIVSPKIRKE